MYQRKLEPDIRCPLEYGLEIFGGKWNSRTICVLAGTLKSLIANGIVSRKSYDEIPPRVEYALSEKGKSVVPILQSICAWSGAFFKTDPTSEMIQCRKCDHK